MARCPAEHESADSDYCDQCGLRMDGPVTVSATPECDAPALDMASTGSGPPCPRCGEPGLDRFCESCGYPAGAEPFHEPAVTAYAQPLVSSASGEAQATSHLTGWMAVVMASRTHYDAVMASAGPDADSVLFPDSYPERRFLLTGSQMRIGRRSASKGILPEIDLSGPPTDPGISRLHAILICQPDGTWAVIDPGSENGVTINDVGIAAGQPVLLHHGDAIRIGAWTSIAILATSAAAGTH